MQDPRRRLQALSMLLEYPDRLYLERLPELESALEEVNPGRFKSGLKGFLSYLRGQAPLCAQECYTAAFDLNPSTTLNMTCHRWRDGEDRAAALSRLQQIYQDAGYEKTCAELPDYLPLMLEFLAVCYEARSNRTIGECLGGLVRLIGGLREKAPAYAELLQLVALETRNPTPDIPPPAAARSAAGGACRGPRRA